MRNPCRITKVDTPWGEYEVSTNPEGSTVAFGPEAEQVDFGYAEHSAAVWFMMSSYAAREGETYTRVYLPA